MEDGGKWEEVETVKEVTNRKGVPTPSYPPPLHTLIHFLIIILVTPSYFAASSSFYHLLLSSSSSSYSCFSCYSYSLSVVPHPPFPLLAVQSLRARLLSFRNARNEATFASAENKRCRARPSRGRSGKSKWTGFWRSSPAACR